MPKTNDDQTRTEPGDEPLELVTARRADDRLSRAGRQALALARKQNPPAGAAFEVGFLDATAADLEDDLAEARAEIERLRGILYADDPTTNGDPR